MNPSRYRHLYNTGRAQGGPSARGLGLGWVDFDFGCSTVCHILLEQIIIWQNWLGKMGEHPKSKSNQAKSASKWSSRAIAILLWFFFTNSFFLSHHFQSIYTILIRFPPSKSHNSFQPPSQSEPPSTVAAPPSPRSKKALSRVQSCGSQGGYPEFVMPKRVPSIQMLPASLSTEEAPAAVAVTTGGKQQYPRSLPITRRFEQVQFHEQGIILSNTGRMGWIPHRKWK